MSQLPLKIFGRLEYINFFKCFFRFQYSCTNYKMDQEEFDKKLDEILRSKDKDVGKLFAKKFLQGVRTHFIILWKFCIFWWNLQAPLSTSFSKTTTPFHLPHISIKSGTKGNEKPPRKNYIVSFWLLIFGI